jgi:ATP-dependent DNA helicase RecG
VSEGEDLARALAPLRNPLAYAAKNDFENLARVKDLEPTLIAAAERLPPALRSALADVLADLGRPGERKAKLRAVAERLEKLVRGDLRDTLGREPHAPSASLSSASDKKSRTSSKADRPVAPAVAVAKKPRMVGPLRLDSEVQFVRGVGPGLAQLLNEKGLKTAEDLLRFLPRRYEDRSLRQSIRDLKPGEGATIQGTVLAKSAKTFRGRKSLEVAIGDDTGVLRLNWFRAPGNFADRFEKGVRLQVSGVVKIFRGQLQMTHPETKLVSETAPIEAEPAGLIPVYSEIEGMRPAQLRKVIAEVLPLAEQLPELLPPTLRGKHELPAMADSVKALHVPPSDTPLDALLDMDTPWHARLIYEELLLLQLVVLRRKAQAASEPGRALAFASAFADTARELFPFTLTNAQSRALREIETDMRNAVPMHRLLQGDVGSGKTAVAMTAAAATAKAGMQTAIMAPTELLAEQHARTALTTLPKVGVRVELLTGSVTVAERKRILAQLASGHVQVVVGTHAIIQQDVRFKALALGIVDEQHRFGVLQRARLLDQGREAIGAVPHVLAMTATPIPRTLALTVYGDLDVSIVNELPPGRTPVKTMLFRDRQRSQVYRRVRYAVENGRQAYVVFPLVEESDKEGMSEIRAATTEAEALAAGELMGLKIAVLHGRMDADEKERTMRAFVRKDFDVLVATTVIEVGIDVPNATVMVIEHAERFGLSQLHQLRGRVGRGAHASECLLVTVGSSSDEAWRRLTVMEKTSDGFAIAEADLEIRGPGDFVGTRQSGLPLLLLANLARDHALLEKARADAQSIIAVDPKLLRAEHAGLRTALESRWERLELAQIG